MTDRIEAAAAELRPLLQEFILWAPGNAPDSDPDLVGPVVLWHRLALRNDVCLWKCSDLRTLLLERMPKVVENPEAAADGMVPAMRAYLRFLAETGRLARQSDPLPALLAALDELEDEFVELMDEMIAEEDWDEEDLDEDSDEEVEGLGDFEPFADDLAALPTIRLRPDGELAAAARAVPLILKARDLASWVGLEHPMGEESPLREEEIPQALAAVGLAVPGGAPPARAATDLWNIWNLAVDLEFLKPDEGNTVSMDADAVAWPFDDDDDVLDTWMQGLHSVDYGDPELDDEDLTLALSGLTRATLVRLLLAGGARELDGLRAELAEAAAEYDDLAEDAWQAAGDPLEPVLNWLTGYGMVTVADGEVRLTPLGVEGVVHLVDDEDIELDARPASDAMTALDLLSLSADLPEEEADAEFTAWLALRTPAEAAEELLTAAAEDESDALVRVQAASMVGSLGEAAIPAWQAALKEPSLRPYATTHLTQLGVAGAPEPTQADTHWLILDMWTIAAGLGRSEFISSLHDIEPAPLSTLLDSIWRVPHPHLEELLEAVSEVHPDKQICKAARRALFKARSSRSSRS